MEIKIGCIPEKSGKKYLTFEDAAKQKTTTKNVNVSIEHADEVCDELLKGFEIKDFKNKQIYLSADAVDYKVMEGVKSMEEAKELLRTDVIFLVSLLNKKNNEKSYLNSL